MPILWFRYTDPAIYVDPEMLEGDGDPLTFRMMTLKACKLILIKKKPVYRKNTKGSEKMLSNVLLKKKKKREPSLQQQQSS